MKEKNKMISVKYESILNDGKNKDAFMLKLPNGVEDWFSKGACELDTVNNILLIPKWLYVARQNEDRWKPKLIQAEIEVDIDSIEEQIINKQIKNEQMEEKNNEEEKDNGPDRTSAENIIKGIIPPSRVRTIQGVTIRVLQKSHKMLFSNMQMFVFGFPKEIAFSFTDDNIFLLPEPKIEGLANYSVKTYGKTGAYLIQNTNLVIDLYNFLKIPDTRIDFYIKATHYMTTGANKKIFKLEVVNK